LAAEYQQKEREYGIAWRSAFKEDLNKRAEELVQKFTGASFDPKKDDALKILIELVSKDFMNARSLDQKCRADLLSMLNENLNLLSINIYTLKKLLKEPVPAKFAVVEKEIT